MATLSELLTSAAAVRNENAAEQNTALRVGNVLYSLTRYLQQYTSVVDITMKVSAVGATITAKSLSGDTTLFDKTIALPVASNNQAGILTAEAYAAIKSDISELQEAFTDLFNEKEEIATRVNANSETIANLRYLVQGRSENSSAYTDPFITLGDIPDWPTFSNILNTLSAQKYMGRCRAKIDGVTVEVYQFINSFSKKDYTQVLLGNVSPGENGQVKFTATHFNIINRQYTNGAWSAWKRMPTATELAALESRIAALEARH